MIHHGKTAIILLLALCLAASSDIVSAQTPLTASGVKTVFLYNFSHFVAWPPQPAVNDNAFVIGILGTDPFGIYLDSLVRGEQVEGRPIVIRRPGEEEDIKNCQILYIHKKNAPSIAKEMQNQSILTAGETDDFATSGGMVRFSFVENKIRLQINEKKQKWLT
jgi:hypothetical protein